MYKYNKLILITLLKFNLKIIFNVKKRYFILYHLLIL